MKTNLFNRTGISLMHSFRNKPLRRTLAAWCAFATLATTCSPAFAGVTGAFDSNNAILNGTSGNVAGSIGGTSGTFTLSSGSVGVLDWSKLNVGAGEQLNYNSAGSWYNVVNSAGGMSTIQGAINGVAGANVMIFNPNGVLVGDGGTINVGGIFGAYAMGMDPADLASWTANPGTLPAANKFTVGPGGIAIEQGATITASAIQLAGAGVLFGGTTTGGTTTPNLHGPATVTAGNAIEIDNVAGGSVKLGSSVSGNVDLMGAFADTLAVKAAGDFSAAGDVSAGGNVTVEAGTVTIAGGKSFISPSADVSLTAKGALEIAGKDTSVFAGGNLSLVSKEGNIALHGGTDGGAQIKAGKALEVVAGETTPLDLGVSIYEDARLEAAGDITIKNSQGYVLVYDAQVKSTAGTVSLTAENGATSAGNVEFRDGAGGDQTLIEATVGNVVIEAMGVANQGEASPIVAGGDLSVTALDDVYLGATENTIGKTVGVYADGKTVTIAGKKDAMTALELDDITAKTFVLKSAATQADMKKIVVTDLELDAAGADVKLDHDDNQIGSVAGTVGNLELVESDNDLVIKTLTAETAKIATLGATGDGNLILADDATLTVTKNDNAADVATLTLYANGDIKTDTLGTGKIVNKGAAGSVATDLTAGGKIELKGDNVFFEDGTAAPGKYNWTKYTAGLYQQVTIRNANYENFEYTLASGETWNPLFAIVARDFIKVIGANAKIDLNVDLTVLDATGEIELYATDIQLNGATLTSSGVRLAALEAGTDFTVSQVAQGATGVIVTDLLKLDGEGAAFTFAGANAVKVLQNFKAEEQLGAVAFRNGDTLLNLGGLNAKSLDIAGGNGVVVSGTQKVLGLEGVKIEAAKGIVVNGGAQVVAGEMTDEGVVIGASNADLTFVTPAAVKVNAATVAATGKATIEGKGANGVEFVQATVAADKDLSVKATSGNVSILSGSKVVTRGNATVEAKNNVTIGKSQLGAAKDVTVLAEKSVQIRNEAKVGADENLTIGTATKKVDSLWIDASEVTAREQIAVNAAGDVNVGNTTAAKVDGKKGVAIAADGNIAIKNGSLVKAGDVSMDASGNPVYGAGDPADLSLVAKKAVTIQGVFGGDKTIVAATKDLTIDAAETAAGADDKGVKIDNAIVATGKDGAGNLTVTARKGDLAIVTDSKVMAEGEADLTTLEGYIAITASTVGSRGDLGIIAKDDLTITLSKVGTDANGQILAMDGSLLIDASQVLAKGDLDVYGADGLSITDTSVVKAGGKLKIRAGEGDIVIGAVELTSGSDYEVTTVNGKIELAGTKLTVGEIDMTDPLAPVPVDSKYIQLAANGANGVVIIKNGAQVAASGDFTITAAGKNADKQGVLIDTATLAAGGNLTLNATAAEADVVIKNGNLYAYGNGTITSADGNISIDPTVIKMSGDITITAAKAVTLEDTTIAAGENTAPGKTVAIRSGARRNLEISGDSAITATGNIEISAGVSGKKEAILSLSDNTSLAAKDDVVLWAEDDVIAAASTTVSAEDDLKVEAFDGDVLMESKFLVGQTAANKATFTALNGVIKLDNDASVFTASVMADANDEIEIAADTIALGDVHSKHDRILVEAVNDITLVDGYAVESEVKGVKLVAANGNITGNGAVFAGKDAELEATLGKIETTGDVTTKEGLDVKAGKAIAMSGKLQAEEAASFVSTGDKAIALTGANVLKDEITLKGGKIALNNDRATKLAEVTAKGDLAITSAGKVEQTAAGVVTVNGKTSVDAGNFDIVLDNAANDFVKYVSAKGKNIELVDQNAIFVGDIAANAAVGTVSLTALGGNIQRAGDTGVAPKITGKRAELTAENGEIQMLARGVTPLENKVDELSAKAQGIRFNNIAALKLDKIVQTDAAKDLTVVARGAITQGDTAIDAKGEANFTAKDDTAIPTDYFDVQLAQPAGGNKFAGTVNAEGANVAVFNAADLKVGVIAAHKNAAVGSDGDVELTVKNGNIADADAVTSKVLADGKAKFTAENLVDKGAIDLQGANVLKGEVTATAHKDITIRNDQQKLVVGDMASAVGNIRLFTTDVALADGADISFANDKTLTAEHGNVALSAYNDLTVAGVINAGHDIELVAGWDKTAGTYRGEQDAGAGPVANGSVTVEKTAVFNFDPQAKNYVGNFLVKANDDVLVAKPDNDAAISPKNGKIDINAEYGNIESHRILNSRNLSGAADTAVNLTAGEYVHVDNDIDAMADDVKITAKGKHDVKGYAILVEQKAGGDATVVTAKKNITLKAEGANSGDIVIGDGNGADETKLVAATGDFTATAEKESVIVRDATLAQAEAGKLDVTASKDVVVQDDAVVQAKVGAVTIAAGNAVHFTDNAKVLAAINDDADYTVGAAGKRLSVTAGNYFEAKDKAEVRASENVVIRAVKAVKVAGEANIDAGKSAILKSTGSAGGAVAVTTTKGIAANDGSVTLENANGQILVENATVKAVKGETGAGNIRITSADDKIQIRKGTQRATLTADQSIVIDTSALVKVDDADLTAAKDITIGTETSVDGIQIVNGSVLTATAGNIKLFSMKAAPADGTIKIYNEAKLTAGKAIVAQAQNDIIVRDTADVWAKGEGVDAAANTVKFQSEAGDILIQGTGAGTDYATVKAGKFDWTATGIENIDGAANLYFFAKDGNVTVRNVAAVGATGKATAIAGDGDITVQNTAYLASAGNMKLDAKDTGAGKGSIVVDNNGNVLTYGTMTATAAKDVTVKNASNVKAGGLAKVTATAGDIKVGADGVVADVNEIRTDDAMELSAKKNIVIQDAALVKAAKSITATAADEDIKILNTAKVWAQGTGVTAGNTIDFTATAGNILVQGPGTGAEYAQVVAGDFTMTPGVLPTPAETDTSKLNFKAGTAITVENQAAVAAAGDFTAVADNGSIAVQKSSAALANGNMVLTANGAGSDIVVDDHANVMAKGTLTATAAKTIKVNEHSVMEAKETATLNAGEHILVLKTSKLGTSGSLNATATKNFTVRNKSLVTAAENSTVQAGDNFLVEEKSKVIVGSVNWNGDPATWPTYGAAKSLDVTVNNNSGTVNVDEDSAVAVAGALTVKALGKNAKVNVTDRSAVLAGGEMKVTADNVGSTMLVDNQSIVAADDAMTLAVRKSVTVDNASKVLAKKDMTLQSAYEATDIKVSNASKMGTDEKLYIGSATTRANSLTVDKAYASITAAKGAEIYAKGDVTVDNKAFIQVGSIAWDPEHPETIDTWRAVIDAEHPAADLVINAKGDITVGGAEGLAAVGATGTAALNAQGATGITVQKNAVLASEGEMKLTTNTSGATGSIVVSDDAVIAANGDMLVNSGDNVLVNNGSKIESKGDMKVYTKADTGIVLVQNSGRIGTSGTLTIGKDDRKAAAIVISGNSTVESTGDAKAFVKGDVLVQNMSYWKTGLIDWDWTDPTTEPKVRNASDLTITADGNVTVINYAAMGASGKATITAKGADGIMVYQNAYLASKDAMDLDATAGSILVDNNGNVIADAALNATADKWIAVQNGSNVKSTGDMVLTAKNREIVVGANATDANTVAADGNVTLDAENSDVTIQGLAKVMAGTKDDTGAVVDESTVTISAGKDGGVPGRDVSITDGALVQATKDVNIDATEGINVTGSATIDAGKSVSMVAGTDGSYPYNGITISTDQHVTAADGSVTINNADGAVTIANGTVEANGANGNIDIDATTGVAVNSGAKVDAEKDLDVKTTGGDITTADNTQLVAGGNFKAENTATVGPNAGNILIDGTVTVAGTTDLDANAQIVAANAQNDFVGAVTADAGLGTAAQENIILQDKNDLEIAHARTVNGSVSARAGFTDGNGSITVSGDGIDANGETSAVGLRAQDNIVVNANVTSEGNGYTDEITLTAGNDISVNASVAADNGNVQANAGNDILINGAGQIEAKGGNAELTAGRDILAATLGTAVLARDTAKLDAGRNIGNPMKVSSKDLDLDANGSVTLAIDRSAYNPTGSLAVDDINTKLSVGGDLDLTVAGNLSTPGGVIRVGGDLDLTVGSATPEINLTLGGNSIRAVNESQQAIAFDLIDGNQFPQVIGTHSDTAVFLDGRAAGGDSEYFSILQSYEAVAVLGLTPDIRGAVLGEKPMLFRDINVNVIDMIPNVWDEQFDDKAVQPEENLAGAEKDAAKVAMR